MVGTVPDMVTVKLFAAWAVMRGRAAPQAVNCSVVAVWAMRSRPLLVAVTPDTVNVWELSAHPVDVSVAVMDWEGVA